MDTDDRLKNLKLYREFLETISLSKYREKYKKVKWVEQNLYKEILPQWSIFKYYWQVKKFLPFDQWFKNFWQQLHSNPITYEILKKFKKYYFDKDDNGWFKLGFQARMYRTWVSVLTQLDLCYLLVHLADKEKRKITLETNAELDLKGIDLKINGINLGVMKISERKEARGGKKKRLISVPYAVFDMETFKKRIVSSRVKPENRKQYKRTVSAFYKYFQMLVNGFVVFGDEYGKKIIRNANSEEALKNVIKNISRKIRGEA